MAKVLILSIPEEEEPLIDKIMAIVNNSEEEQKTELRKRVSIINIAPLYNFINNIPDAESVVLKP